MSSPIDLSRPRISTIDLVRGIVMVIMALDHVRDFFHEGAFTFDPTDPALTTTGLFITRWITHFCAPTFVLLSGVSIRLSLQRKTKQELSRFLWTRGLWLIFLEFTVVRFSFFFNLYYDFTVVQVIYTLGVSMVLMSALIYLKESVLLVLGLVIVFGHNLLDYFPVTPQNPFFAICTFIYQGGPLVIAPGKVFMIGYPFLPWLGILLLGFAIGKWYTNESLRAKRSTSLRAKRSNLLMITGLSAIALFILLRTINFYGDPAPWKVYPESIRTVYSFFNCSKYPVSLLYTLMTLGPVLVIMSVLENISIQRLKPLEVFGRVPMFYYIIHFYLIHVLAILTFLVVRHKTFSDLNFHFSTGDNFLSGPAGQGYFGGVPIGAGYSLPWVYLVWVIVILIMYPLSKKYNAYKSSHNAWWLGYL